MIPMPSEAVREGLARLLRSFTHADSREEGRTTPPNRGQVRRLRVEIAAALDAQRPSRTAEAVAELDKALHESGEDPSDGAIHLLAGRLWQSRDPVAALCRLLVAVTYPDVSGEAVRLAQSLIDSGDQGRRAVAQLSTEDVQRLTRSAGTGEGPLRLFTARVLRERGEDDAALELLRATVVDPGPRRLDVLAEVAELLLDLGHPDEVLALPREDDPRLSLAALRARLLQADFDGVLAGVDQHASRWGGSPDLTDVECLALVGRGSSYEAAQRLHGAQPASRAAEVVVTLAVRRYDTARIAAVENLHATPSDPSAVLLDVQVELESLGHDPFDLDAPRASEQYENARALLGAVTSGLAVEPRRLWWSRVQDVVRAHDGPYQFFAWQLRAARDEPVTGDELRDIDLSRTTFLHDAVIYERLASLALSEDGNPTAAADAYERAAGAWGSIAIRDYESSVRCAEAAYRHDPNEARAATLAYAVVDDSYRVQDLAPLLERMERTLVLGRRHMERSADLVRLTSALAVLHGRRSEVATRDRYRLRCEAVPWLLAAGQLSPSDAAVHSLLASVLRWVGHIDGALHFALRGMAAEDNAYSVSTVAICRFDQGDYGAVEELLSHQELASETAWLESMRGAVRLYSGTLDDGSLHEPDETAPLWALTHAALAATLVAGFDRTQSLVRAVFDRLEPEEVAVDELVLSCVTDRRAGPAGTLDLIRSTGNLNPGDLRLSEILVAWLADARLPVESLVKDVGATVIRLSDLDAFERCYGPIVVAARAGEDRPSPLLIPSHVREACRERLAAGAGTWVGRLDDISPGLGALLRVTEPDLSVDELRQAGRVAGSALAGSGVERVVDLLIEQVTERALDELVQRHLRWRLGRGAPDPAGVALALEPDRDVSVGRRLAVLVAAQGGSAALIEHMAGASLDDQAQAAGIFGAAAAAAVQDVPELWVLYDAVTDGWDDAGLAAGLRRLIRDELVHVVARLLVGPGPEQSDLSSYVALVIGADFVPEDTSEQWTLFKDLLPAMKRRLADRTGYAMPGVSVRGDDRFRDSLWVQINGATRSAHRLPVDGWVAVCAPQEATGKDPLTGRPVAWRTSRPHDAESWTALEYLVRWVEVCVAGNVKDLINVYDVLWAFEDEDAAVRTRMLSSAPLFVGALDVLRACADDETLGNREVVRRRLTALSAETVRIAGLQV